jgi:DNA-binding beta-propeller fold protein YncE
MPTVDDILSSLPQSCAFDCIGKCTEPTTPYDCPTVKPWDTLPHEDACGAWDGTFPTPTQGKCTSSDATGEAAKKAGAIPGGLILPDGHRILPAGKEIVFAEQDLQGGFPMSVMALPGTHFAVSSDGGIGDNALRVLDLDKLALGNAPVASYVAFPRPSSLFYGMAYIAPGRIYASGGGDAMVYAFDVDPSTGALTRASSKDVALGMADPNNPYYAGPIAVSADGKSLLVAPNDHSTNLLVMSIDAVDYGTKKASIKLSSPEIFDLQADPFDPTGNTFYASDTGNNSVHQIDLAQGKVVRSVKLKKNPAGMVFLDAQYMLVAESDGDGIAIVDRAAGTVVSDVAIEDKAPHGFAPSQLTYDAATHRLYVTLAAINAVEAFDITPGAPPKVAPAGRIPTAWWPTGVAMAPDGALIITNGKGHGVGNGTASITDRLHGSVQSVPAADLMDLTAATKIVNDALAISKLAGAAAVTCPNGADDFPIPTDPSKGASKQIKHVILVVRENKTYDAVFGDDKKLGDGDPSLILASSPELQAKIWKNAHDIGRAFVNFDNFYTDAEQSIQGHTWTVYGRTTDFMERSWLSIWGRGTRGIATPALDVATPEEGGVFKWMAANNVTVDDMGEIVGQGSLDGAYPGFAFAQNRPDVDKSCYMNGRIRLKCDLKQFTYAVQPNDHTYGGQEGSPSPEVMIAVNDEATGQLLDGLSHSPSWANTLLIVTEDDPQDGGDHVDLHRSVLFMASPWVKRGYVSHGHYDMASVYKIVAHVLGIPYNNTEIENALLPYDAFTSTPDYTPYTYTPRTVTGDCNGPGTKEAHEAAGWDFSDPDDQPGLSQQIARMMKRPPAERGIRIVK